MRVFDCGGVRVEISTDALAVLRAHTQADDADEAGGVLLGQTMLDGALVIDQVTEPMPGDERGARYFHRGAESHQRAIEAAWHESGRTRGYLGEWHTHAQPDPTPSRIDLQDWSRRLVEDVLDGERIVFVIVGTAHLRVWWGVPGSPAIHPALLVS